ncbi:MAG: multidrug ABC transporter permease [Planctomycetes bacterium]|nr:multidrug ABC transporter permease [Planctomycetota bacterium]
MTVLTDEYGARQDHERDRESGRPPLFAAVMALCWREVIRFLRQRHRVIGALGQPVLFWLLFGVGLDRSFRLESQGSEGAFLEYYFPGTLILVALFTAIFATISIIEDRKEGFLQSVLVAPIPRWVMVLGKVSGATLIAVLQGVVFLCLAFCFRWELSLPRFLAITLLLTVASIAMTSLGFVIAWRMDSTQGFHAIMNLALMPMWLLSGAFFPVPAITPDTNWRQAAMHWAMRLDPLTYAVAGVRRMLSASALPDPFFEPGVVACWTATLLFAVGMFGLACWTASRGAGGESA